MAGRSTAATALTIRSLGAKNTWRSAAHATNCKYAPHRTAAADQAAFHRPASGRSADLAGADGGVHKLRVPADRAWVRWGGTLGDGDGLGTRLRMDGPERGGAP